MTKTRKRFFCQQCGMESAKWIGRCPGCFEWNTFVQEPVASSRSKTVSLSTGGNLVGIAEISAISLVRYQTGSKEVDRVLGGGLVPGSLLLLGGDPGIGKSTLLLQISAWIAQNYGPVLYVSAEESPQQIGLRAARLGVKTEALLVLTEANLDLVSEYIAQKQPKLVVVDSIQTVHAGASGLAPGTLGQVRESTAYLMQLAKTTQTVIWIVGHVTKEGTIAGPRVLEHMVDVVLYLEGEGHHSFRMLRGAKNRFGSTHESGLLEMETQGLMDVHNPSAWFLAERPVGMAGSVVVASLEGTRPLLLEIQGLVGTSGFGQPRRSITGADYNRVSLVLAVLEKRVGLHILNQDIFVNVVGGVRLQEPAVDLGIAIALTSSFRDLPVPADYVVMGEIGLTGEIRSVGQIERRMREAQRLGFKHVVIPQGNEKNLKHMDQPGIIPVATLEQALEIVLPI